MIRKLLIGILVILEIAMAVLNQLIIGILAVVVWIYLSMIVQQQKKNIFNDQLESKISELHLNRLEAFLIVAGFSSLIFIVGGIMHNVLYGLSEIEESVFLIIALVTLVVFIVTTSGGLVIFLKGRQNAI